MINLDASGMFRVNDGCELPANMQHKAWFILPPTIEYYYRQRNHDYALLPPLKPGCSDPSPGKLIEIIYPQQDTKIYVPVEIDGNKGRTVFSATHKTGSAKLFWSIDETFVGSTERFHQLAVSPPAGKHLLTLTDEQGNAVSRSFEIIDK
jgi:penicillin-binding protein 1C